MNVEREKREEKKGRKEEGKNFWEERAERMRRKERDEDEEEDEENEASNVCLREGQLTWVYVGEEKMSQCVVSVSEINYLCSVCGGKCFHAFNGSKVEKKNKSKSNEETVV